MIQDIILDSDFDLLFENGDLVIDESTSQHQQLLLMIDKGENREFPTHGVAINNWLNGEGIGDLNAAIKLEFERDGMKVKVVKNVNGKINVEASY